MSRILDKLYPLRNSGKRNTLGINDASIEKFLESDYKLIKAIDRAVNFFYDIMPHELKFLDEDEQIIRIQEGFLNFYDPDSVVPYVPAGACGPWVVTSKGAIVYDAAGYGMLGFGHTPRQIQEVLAKPWPMANVMTAQVPQWCFDEALRKEIGHTGIGYPYDKIMCLNSGSEANSLVCRIADTLSGITTGKNGSKPGAMVKRVVLNGGFHGRTERPALLSHSSRSAYSDLSSFRNEDSVIVVDVDDVSGLEKVYEAAENNNWFIEMFIMEPVMGEGNPGYAVSREFYETVRRLTKEHGSLMVVDSVQAGLRAFGVLSVVDYPHFQGCEPPDMETFSKALNAGQFPLSVVVFNKRAAQIYQRGTYGNTMTGNARAMMAGVKVLESFTPELRENICSMGALFVSKLEQLSERYPEIITNVQGSGLLVSCEIANVPVSGHDSFEEFLRIGGLNAIHGGSSSLRFTPIFDVTEAEIDLMIEIIDAVAHKADKFLTPPLVGWPKEPNNEEAKITKAAPVNENFKESRSS